MVAAKSSPTYAFGDLLAIARQSWVKQMTWHLDRQGYPDYRPTDAVIMRLLIRGPMAIGELGAALGTTRQAARKLAEALVRRGYARTECDKSDSRRLNVVLTPAGEEYTHAIVDIAEALNRDLADSVDPEGLRAADAVLRAVLDAGAARRAESLIRRPGIGGDGV